jgi:hypothetical protein
MIITYVHEIQNMAHVKKIMEYTNLKQLRLWRDRELNQDRLLAKDPKSKVA